MATTDDKDRRILEAVLCETAQFYQNKEARTVTVFDERNDQYLLVDEGWSGYKRIHRTWVHVELRDGKFWIQLDNTEDGVTYDLLKAGVPKERIVLAFQHPVRRERGEFAVA